MYVGRAADSTQNSSIKYPHVMSPDRSYIYRLVLTLKDHTHQYINKLCLGPYGNKIGGACTTKQRAPQDGSCKKREKGGLLLSYSLLIKTTEGFRAIEIADPQCSSL